MADRSPITAAAADGQVVITVDPDTALDLMVGFQAAHEASPALAAVRPDWYFDVLTLVTAAAEAAIQAHGAPSAALVPLVAPGSPVLRLVDGAS